MPLQFHKLFYTHLETENEMETTFFYRKYQSHGLIFLSFEKLKKVIQKSSCQAVEQNLAQPWRMKGFLVLFCPLSTTNENKLTEPQRIAVLQ